MTATKSRIYLRIEERSGRDQIRDALADFVRGVDDRAAWSRQLAHACEVAGAPWWVRGEVIQVRERPDLAVNAAWAARMWLAGWNRDDWLAFIAPPETDGLDLAEILAGAWPPCQDTEGLGDPFPRKHPAVSVPRPDEPEDGTWWEAQQEGVAGCKATVGLWSVEGGHAAHALGCGVRSCPTCAKSAQWRAVSRYLTGFAAPLDRAHRLEMTTLTSTRPIATPRDLSRWRRGVAQVCKAMVQGRKTLGIPAGAWKGGLIVVETVRKGDGLQYAHAHLLVVARRWYPFGRSLRRARREHDQGEVVDMSRVSKKLEQARAKGHPVTLGAAKPGQRRNGKGTASVEGLFDLVDRARRRRRHRRRPERVCEAGARFDPGGPDRYTPTGRLRLDLADRAAAVINRRRAARGQPPRYAAGPLRWVLPDDRFAHRQRDGHRTNWRPHHIRWRGQWIKLRDPRELFGMRELLRRNAIGEVVDVEFVDQKTDAKGAVLNYLSKVQAYAAKVQADDPTAAAFWSDPQVQWVLKGARRCQPFGCFMKLHAGPTARGAELAPGQDHGRHLFDVVSADYLDVLVNEQIQAAGDERPLQRRRAERGIPWIVPDPAERYTLHRFNMSRLRQWRHARVGKIIDLVHRRTRPTWAPPPPRWPAPQPRAGEPKGPKPREISKERKAEWQPSLWPGEDPMINGCAPRPSRGGTFRRKYGSPDSAKRQGETDRGTRTRTRDLRIWKSLAPLGGPVKPGLTGSGKRRDSGGGGTRDDP